MTLEEFAARLGATGLPVTYHGWPEGEAPELPFLCYLSTGADTLPADGGVYVQWDNVRVELYTAKKDSALEATVEAALAGFTWTKDQTYIKAERCYMTVYEVDV
jgi:hypothetical protein